MKKMMLVVRLVATILLIPLAEAQTQSQPQSPKTSIAKPDAAKLDTSKLTITTYAREHGFSKCASAVELAERNLLGNSEYTFRAYLPPMPPKASPNAEFGLFSVIVDSRKIDRNSNAGNPTRATLNLTVNLKQTNSSGSALCSTIYEQTMYHNATCDTVAAQMAPNARTTGSASIGSVLVEISDTLSLTLIPVGAAQCITIIKEAAFDVPTKNVLVKAGNPALVAPAAAVKSGKP